MQVYKITKLYTESLVADEGFLDLVIHTAVVKCARPIANATKFSVGRGKTPKSVVRVASANFPMKKCTPVKLLPTFFPGYQFRPKW